MERLHKYMARYGVASRRKCEGLIAEGRVAVNGITVKKAGTLIDPYRDRVKVDGKAIGLPDKKIHIMLNKPEGYVSTVRDQFGRPTVLDLIQHIRERIYPVGRLDYDSEGLILLTNDGELTYGLTHPRHEIKKTYIVTVAGNPAPWEVNRLRKGILIDGRSTSPARVSVLKTGKDNSVYRVIIHEGRNRQLRRMFKAIGCEVVSLKRTAIGNLKLGELPSGRWRFLRGYEVDKLLQLCNRQ